MRDALGIQNFLHAGDHVHLGPGVSIFQFLFFFISGLLPVDGVGTAKVL